MNKDKTLLPLVIIFILISTFLLVSKSVFDKWMINEKMLLVANISFFLVSMLISIMQSKAMQSANPNAFVRSVMAGMMLKMFVCIAVILTYIYISGKSFSKLSIYLSMLIYLVYLIVQVNLILKLNKRKNA